MQTTSTIDPITLSVVRGALETAQREMTLTLEKTARSSVFNLAHDYSNALFDHLPEMILQGQDIPIHLGSLMPAMKAVAEYFGDDIHEGDVIYHNDPVYQGSHILDCCMYKPVFYHGGVQRPRYRHRRPGARRLQPRCQRNLRRRAAHSAGEAVGQRRAPQ